MLTVMDYLSQAELKEVQVDFHEKSRVWCGNALQLVTSIVSYFPELAVHVQYIITLCNFSE